MIDVKELMLNSIIDMPFIGGSVTVIGIAITVDGELFIQAKKGDTTFFEKPEKYEPIPLTEEWLRKCGFTKIEQNIVTSYRKDRFVVFEPRDGNEFMYIMVGATPVNLKCLHTLQNAFALTGKELEVGLP